MQGKDHRPPAGAGQGSGKSIHLVFFFSFLQTYTSNVKLLHVPSELTAFKWACVQHQECGKIIKQNKNKETVSHVRIEETLFEQAAFQRSLVDLGDAWVWGKRLDERDNVRAR